MSQVSGQVDVANPSLKGKQQSIHPCTHPTYHSIYDEKSYRTINLPPVSAPSENYVEVLKTFSLQKEITRKSVIKSKKLQE